MTALNGQEHPELITDRPDQTESAETVPFGSMQIESGFNYGQEKYPDNIFRKSYDVNSTLLRFGLFDKAELRTGISFPYNELTGSTSEYSIGTKIGLLDNRGFIPQSGLIIDFTIDNKTRKVAPAFIFAFAFDIPHDLSLGINVGADDFNFKYSTVLGIALSENMAGYFEMYGGDTGSRISLLSNAGFTYLLNKTNQLDLSTGYSISQPKSWFMGIGYSLRFMFK